MAEIPQLPGQDMMGKPTTDEPKAQETPPEEKATPPSRKNKAQLAAENAELKEKLAVLEGIDLNKLQALIDANPRGGEGEREPRAPMAEGDALRGDDSRSTRRSIGHKRILDADFYVDRYPDKQLMWVNDVNGEVNKWIDAGAEPVAVENATTRVYEGINDSFDFKYVRAVGGTYAGQDFWVYLLMMDKKQYHDVKIEPLRERQRAITDTLYRGRNQSRGAGGQDQGFNRNAISGAGVETYAPQLPTGDGEGMRQVVSHHAEMRDAI